MEHNAYVRFLSLMRAIYKDDVDALRVDDLLAYLYELAQAGRHPNMTELVRQDSFGTLQTLTKYLRQMERDKLVTLAPGDDRRANVVRLTETGCDRLRQREILLLGSAMPKAV